MESFQSDRYRALGISAAFVQDNVSRSQKGILRGLHFQNPHPQGKLVTVLQGEVFDVAVDLRRSSPTFKQYETFHLSGENLVQVYIPHGFAHGFAAISDNVILQYKCTDAYCPEAEQSILWNDPDLNIPWPLANPLISKKDLAGLALKDISEDMFFA